jgi:hypothetical protein
MRRLTAALALLSAIALPAHAQEQEQTQVQGVNPADLLTQVQITGEYNRIDGDTDQWLLVGKYDYKIAGSNVGLNFELPMVISLDGPGYNANGHGDLFARARYVRTFGQWSFGGAFEVGAPIGSDAFSAGRWLTNPGALAVYAWDRSNITAVVHKRVFGYVNDDSSKPDVNQYQWRALQIHIFPTGWFAQGDVAHWNDILTNASWYDTRFSVGKQISATTRLQGEIKKLSGDLSNDWALSLSYAVKL